jgi:hypothetical protein
MSFKYKENGRVKLRKRKSSDVVSELFSVVFNNKFKDIHYRSLFATGGHTDLDIKISKELLKYYIFPINGYKFLYSKEIQNSREDYKRAIDILLSELDDAQTEDIVKDLIKFNYTSNNLKDGIISGCEIMFYGIPAFYAIPCMNHFSYNTLLYKLENI